MADLAVGRAPRGYDDPATMIGGLGVAMWSSDLDAAVAAPAGG